MRFRWTASLLGLLFLLSSSAPAPGQCDFSEWSQRLFPDRLTGTSGKILAATGFDDGAGPALYAGGDFTTAGSVAVDHIARWDGSRWSRLARGLDDVVWSLAVFDDGTGPALYAGGAFATAGGTPASHIARWDGSSWTPLGAGVDDIVRSLAVFDDGTGPALYAAGHFTTAGGVAASKVARWDGSTWSALGSGLGPSPQAYATSLTVFDDGTGSALYAGGRWLGSSQPLDSVFRWDGAAWASIGNGIDGPAFALTVFDDGTGPALYVGGGSVLPSSSEGGIHIARWDGRSWASIGDRRHKPVLALNVFNDGGGPALYVGSEFTISGGAPRDSDVARWDGSAWLSLVDGILSGRSVSALAVFDAGDGPALYAVGEFFNTSGGTTSRNIVRLAGNKWLPLGSEANRGVLALAAFDNGTTTALYAGGDLFVVIGGSAADHIARWDGGVWTALRSGVDGTVSALAVYDDTTGPALYAGGDFTTAGGVAADHIARWDGSAWTALGSGVDGAVSALAVYDGGTRALYAGGDFTTAGGVAANHIARWDRRRTWSALGSGLDGRVSALAVLDDGAGPALYVGGEFTTAGGAAASNIARWDGMAWSALGSGMDGPVFALVVHDDGAGPALYVGGEFTTAGGAAASNIARWDGMAWSALGSGMDGPVFALVVHDDGAGAALHAGGEFTTAGGAAASSIARWDGTTWSALGIIFGGGPVRALARYDGGAGPELYAGGGFSVTEGGSCFVEKWQIFRPTCFRRGDLNDDGTVDVTDAVMLVHGPRTGIGCQMAWDVRGIDFIEIGSRFLARYVFLGDVPPLVPGPDECGPEPGPSFLDCASYESCAGPLEPPQGPPFFNVSFEAPEKVTGAAGQVVRFPVAVLLTAEGLEAGEEGARGWSLSIELDGCTFARGTMETGGSFGHIEEAGREGVVSSSVLETGSFLGEGEHRILTIEIEATAPPVANCAPCMISLADGLQGSGLPVANVVEFNDMSFKPSSHGISVEVCGTLGGSQLPGDCTQDGTLDLSDAVCLFGFLFLSSPPGVACGDGSGSDPANLAFLDHNDDGGIDLSDGIGLLHYLFLGGAPPSRGTECIRLEACPDVCR